MADHRLDGTRSRKGYDTAIRDAREALRFAQNALRRGEYDTAASWLGSASAKANNLAIDARAESDRRRGLRPAAAPARRRAPSGRGAKLPIKLVFSDDGLTYEIYSSHATAASAEARRDRIIEEAAARRHSHWYNGWWMVLDRSVDPAARVSELGVGRCEGKPLPAWQVTRG